MPNPLNLQSLQNNQLIGQAFVRALHQAEQSPEVTGTPLEAAVGNKPVATISFTMFKTGLQAAAENASDPAVKEQINQYLNNMGTAQDFENTFGGHDKKPGVSIQDVHHWAYQKLHHDDFEDLSSIGSSVLPPTGSVLPSLISPPPQGNTNMGLESAKVALPSLSKHGKVTPEIPALERQATGNTSYTPNLSSPSIKPLTQGDSGSYTAIGISSPLSTKMDTASLHQLPTMPEFNLVKPDWFQGISTISLRNRQNEEVPLDQNELISHVVNHLNERYALISLHEADNKLNTANHYIPASFRPDQESYWDQKNSDGISTFSFMETKTGIRYTLTPESIEALKTAFLKNFDRKTLQQTQESFLAQLNSDEIKELCKQN